MEQQQNWTQLLELLERPAFTVEQGRVSWANREALARLVSTGQEIHALLQTGAEEYAHLGCSFWTRKPTWQGSSSWLWLPGSSGSPWATP